MRKTLIALLLMLCSASGLHAEGMLIAGSAGCLTNTIIIDTQPSPLSLTVGGATGTVGTAHSTHTPGGLANTNATADNSDITVASGVVTPAVAGTTHVDWNEGAGGGYCAAAQQQSSAITVSAAPTDYAAKGATSSYGTVANNTDFQLAGPMTIEAWLYNDGTDRGTLYAVEKKNSYGISLSGSGAAACRFNNTLVADGTNNWSLKSVGYHHVACVVDGTSGRIYVDGLKTGENVAIQNNLTTNTNAIIFLAYSTAADGIWLTKADEIRISNVARYTGSTCTVPTATFTDDANTMGLWKFNEGSGTSFTDSSSKSYGGTWTGSPILNGAGKW